MIEGLPNHEDWLYLMDIDIQWADTDTLQEAICLLDPVSILLKRRQTRQDERWAAFHALSHLRLHRGSQIVYSRNGRSADVQKQEAQAEDWTARLLLPAEHLAPAVLRGADLEEIAELFDVPLHGARRAIELLALMRP